MISDADIEFAIGGPVQIPEGRLKRIAYWRFILDRLEEVYGRDRLYGAWFMHGLGGAETERKLNEIDDENMAWNAEKRAEGTQPYDRILAAEIRSKLESSTRIR